MPAALCFAVAAALVLAALVLATRRTEGFDTAPAPESVFANFRKLGDVMRGVDAAADPDDEGDAEATADVATDNLQIIERLLDRPALYKEVLERAKAKDAYRTDMLGAIVRGRAPHVATFSGR